MKRASEARTLNEKVDEVRNGQDVIRKSQDKILERIEKVLASLKRIESKPETGAVENRNRWVEMDAKEFEERTWKRFRVLLWQYAGEQKRKKLKQYKNCEELAIDCMIADLEWMEGALHHGLWCDKDVETKRILRRGNLAKWLKRRTQRTDVVEHPCYAPARESQVS